MIDKKYFFYLDEEGFEEKRVKYVLYGKYLKHGRWFFLKSLPNNDELDDNQIEELPPIAKFTGHVFNCVGDKGEKLKGWVYTLGGVEIQYHIPRTETWEVIIAARQILQKFESKSTE